MMQLEIHIVHAAQAGRRCRLFEISNKDPFAAVPVLDRKHPRLFLFGR
jgi:hypothetical protein